MPEDVDFTELDDEGLARAFAYYKQKEAEHRVFRQRAEGELLRRLDERDASEWAVTEQLLVTLTAPGKSYIWDTAATRKLRPIIGPADYDRLVTEETRVKVKTTGMKSLAKKRGAEVATAIEAAYRTEEKGNPRIEVEERS